MGYYVQVIYKSAAVPTVAKVEDRRGSPRWLRRQARVPQAAAIVFALQALVGCQPTSRTYAIESASFRSAMGDIEFTTFAEVPATALCDVATKSADKGIREGSPSGKTTPGSRRSNCVSELPEELQKVERGERLPGAFIIKTSPPLGPPGYSVVRGFPVDRPELVCRMLIERMKERILDERTTLTCQYPLGVASAGAVDAPRQGAKFQ